MNPVEYYPALLLFAFSASVTPGPNNVMVLASGLNYGIRRSLPHLLGVVVGFPLMLVLLGFTLGFLFERFPVLHLLIRTFGVCYLLFLAWKIGSAMPGRLNEGKVGKPFTFLQSALFQWLNPKGLVMATGAIATFTSNGPDQWQQVLVIALTFVIATALCNGGWLVFGAGLKHLLGQPRHMKVFNVCMALLLALSVAPVAQELLLQYLAL